MNRQITKIGLICAFFAGLILFFLGSASGAAVPREDLSACELPHGTVELAEEGSPLALRQRGYIFNFETERLMRDPWDEAGERAPSMQAYVQRIRDRKTGDMAYSSLNDGTLVAMSGRIRDLGRHFLYEFDGKKLKRPGEVWGTEQRDSTGKSMPGAIEGVEEGRCYIVETVTGKYALVRLIEKKGRSAIIDWVYQPSGKRLFEIPRGEITERPPGGRVAPFEKGRLAKPRAVPIISVINEQRTEEAAATHLANRKALTESLVKILGSPDETRWTKALSVRSLGEMRAVGAAPLLASIIDAHLPTSQAVLEADRNVIFGCVRALIKIGKPGAAACLEEIVKLTPEDREKPFKEKLLCLVIVRVEGEKIARILLEDRKEKATEPEQIENLQRAIDLIDKVKSWR